MASKKTEAASTNNQTLVTLKRLQDDEVTVRIEGLTPYIPHKWSEKAKRMMPGHPDKEEVADKKGVRTPKEEAEACVYRLPNGQPGIPATAIKAAMVGACRFFDGITMTEAKLKFHVVGHGPDQLVPLTGTPRLREDTPRNANGGADLRFRTEFVDWGADVTIKFISSVIGKDSIVALVDAAGRLGVGDWRPSAPKSATGTYGTFRVVTEEETN